MRSLHLEHRVRWLGDELIVYGGKAESCVCAVSLEVYRPARDEWRVVENFWRQHLGHFGRQQVDENELVFMELYLKIDHH